MKPALSAPLLALASRLLMHVAVRLLGPQRATWGRAMQAELQAIGDEREALAMAWGCVCAALGHAFEEARAGLTQPHPAGAGACCIAVLLGCACMHAAGAPGQYVVMNLGSLALALAMFRLLPRQRLSHDERLRARLCFGMGALLLALGLWPVSGAAPAWLRLGPVAVNLTWLLLPALWVASDVHPRSGARAWALGGLVMACGALALLAEPVLAGLLAALLGLRAWSQHSGAMASLAMLSLVNVATALWFGAGWPASEAVPFVDGVLLSGFAQGPAIGLALVLLQLLPLWPALGHRRARQHGLIWGLLVLLSLPGWLPSPLVGFGGSFIVGYLLSLALLPADAGRPPAGASAPSSAFASTSARPRRDPPSWRRSGLA